MYNDFVGNRIESIRTGIAADNTDHNVRADIDKMLAAIDEGAFCFRMEPWHNVSVTESDSSEAMQISEMLLHIPLPRAKKFDLQRVIGAIYGAGLHRPFDSAVVALAIQQAEGQRHAPIAINISPESACDKRFWEEIGPLLSRFSARNIVFELVEEDFTPNAEQKSLIETARRMGYRFALDDMENNDRDARRLESLGDLVDFIKIDGAIVEEWELGLPGLHSYLQTLRSHAGHACFVAEWVTSIPRARALARMGFHAVQGRCLPASRREFCLRYARTRDGRHAAPEPLVDAFADVMEAAM